MNFPKRNYKTNEERTNEALTKFNKDIILKSHIKSENPIIFDIGANVGQSVAYYKKLFPNCKIHCFEPDPDTFIKLKENCKNIQNVYLNNYGIGSETNTIDFYKNDNITSEINSFNKINKNSNDSISLNNNGRDEFIKKINNKIQCNIRKLSDYINNNNIHKIDILKLDTQGYEEECLKGIEDKFKIINIIITEIMFYDFYEKSLSFYDIEKYLIPNDFKLYDISHISKNPMNGRTDWVDAMYIKNNIL